MNAAAGVKAYSNVGLESSLSAADPLKLILMLYQGALLAIASARNQMLRGETAAKGASISKAIMIIGEGLRASLNLEAGGEIGQNLASLYDYMNNRLFLANLNNDPAMLDEVSRLLTELQGAWESIRQTNVATATVQVAQQTSPANKTASLVYGRN
jgi:flagellar secretion chaperone FliS